jgi:hypothetical protein
MEEQMKEKILKIIRKRSSGGVTIGRLTVLADVDKKTANNILGQLIREQKVKVGLVKGRPRYRINHGG